MIADTRVSSRAGPLRGCGLKKISHLDPLTSIGFSGNVTFAADLVAALHTMDERYIDDINVSSTEFANQCKIRIDELSTATQPAAQTGQREAVLLVNTTRCVPVPGDPHNPRGRMMLGSSHVFEVREGKPCSVRPRTSPGIFVSIGSGAGMFTTFLDGLAVNGVALAHDPPAVVARTVGAFVSQHSSAAAHSQNSVGGDICVSYRTVDSSTDSQAACSRKDEMVGWHGQSVGDIPIAKNLDELLRYAQHLDLFDLDA